MASIIKVFKTLRNHWKKSIFGSALLAYGINAAVNKYETLNLMRAYCEEASKHGDEPLSVSKQPRHLTVILNPSAKNGKGKALFEKYAAPLFYLAGIKVSLVQTEYEGQAKSLMEIMDNTDAVVIAGGDGTVSEAVTGLLQRSDRDTAMKRFPIGVLPLGKTNTLAKTLFWNKDDSEVRWITEAAMAIIRNFHKPIDVMYIEGEAGKNVYAVGKVDWGAFRDTEAKIPKYWYWGPLKAKAAYFFSSLKGWPSSFQAKIEYTPPCSGCSKCYKKNNHMQKNNNNISSTGSKRWWQAFIKPVEPFPKSTNDVDYSKIINDNCDLWQTHEFQSAEISVTTKNVDPEKADIKESFLEVHVTPNDLTRTEFFNEGLNHLQTGNAGGRAQKLQAKEIRLTPLLKEEEESWYSIDSEAFEVKPIVIKLLPNNLFVYHKK